MTDMITVSADIIIVKDSTGTVVYKTPATPLPPDPTTPTPPEPVTQVAMSDTLAQVQAKLNAVPAGGSLVFPASYMLTGALRGKSDITLWADGIVTAQQMDFSGFSNWTIRGKAPSAGFRFNGPRILAANARNFAVGNCQFNQQPSAGYAGAAIDLVGAAFGLIINSDFNGCQGNVLGMYNLDNITFDGLHFIDCWQPFSIQEPIQPGGSNLVGRNLVWRRCIFKGTKRACIEVGPENVMGEEFLDGFIVEDCYFDQFNTAAGQESACLAISQVAQNARNTTIRNNFIRKGTLLAGKAIGIAIEQWGSGECSGNVIDGMLYAGLLYANDWNVHDNKAWGFGSWLASMQGWAKNGGTAPNTGTFANNQGNVGTVPDWPEPTRRVW